MTFHFEAYQIEKATEVVNLWNSTVLGASFPMTERFWRQQTEGDPDFEPADLRLAYPEFGEASVARSSSLVGFVLLKCGRGKAALPVPYHERGFIAALAVAETYQRQGLGRELVNWAETELKAQGVKQIYIGANMHHFFPGLPADLAPLKKFFLEMGYYFAPPEQNEYDLRGSLRSWVSPPMPPVIIEGDFYFGQGQEGEQEAIIAFLGRSFPGRWQYELELFFAQGGLPQDISLLKRRTGEIEGFLMNYHRQSIIIGPGIFWSGLLEPTYGGIGPLGIAQEVRGVGLGLALVVAGLKYLRSRGVTDCVIDWTTLLKFYGRLGFRPWKRYERVYKEIL